MNYPNFKNLIDNIRKEGLELGFAVATMDKYQCIWNKYILWKNKTYFIYNEKDYSKFLLEQYNFNVTTYSSKSKSRHKCLMRSKRILDDWDTYKIFMIKRSLPKVKYNKYPNNWNVILDDYLKYCKNIRYNSDNTIKIKKHYLISLFAYFYQNNVNKISNLTNKHINMFITHTINKGYRSQGRYFYILKNFLEYLFIENRTINDLSIYVPSIKNIGNKKMPTYLNCDDIENLLKNIPREKKVDIRNYVIILIAARLGLRISDILNIKLKDIEPLFTRI